jgi:hypothetical protein
LSGFGPSTDLTAIDFADYAQSAVPPPLLQLAARLARTVHLLLECF